jgi:dolichol-phosphate mannosyltransferase
VDFDLSGLLSIIIPSFNEEGNIGNTAKVVLEIMDRENINCELLFVSDGSKDKTFEAIEKPAAEDSRERGVEFSRNFGKEAAMLAGLANGNGDCFVVMDCDLQHPPETIVEMYRLWEQGYEIIEGIKKSRGDESWLHKKFANFFYGILSSLTGFDMGNTSDFKLIDKRVAEILVKMPERKTFFRAMTFWVGFKSCNVYYEVAERAIGESKWSVMSLIKYAVSNIISFSSIPLNIVTYLGTATVCGGVILGLHTIWRWATGTAVEGFTTVILLLLFIGGAILIGLGLIGRYIAAIYEETKQRPRYIIGKACNIDKVKE